MLPAAPHAAAALGLIKYASVAVVTLSVRADAIEAPHEAGFLVTRNTGWLTTACSYGSAKWPNWAAGGDQPDDSRNAILRVSVGRDDDDRHTRLDDAELRDTVLGELSSLPPLRRLSDPGRLSPSGGSRAGPQSLPQYRPGHGQLVDRISEALAREMPGVFVTGGRLPGASAFRHASGRGNEGGSSRRAALGLGPRLQLAVSRAAVADRLPCDGRTVASP